MATVMKAPAPALGSSRLSLAQHSYNTYLCKVPHGLSPDAVLDMGYWKHHIRTLRPMDVVRCFAEDGTWETWLTVIVPEQTGVRMSLLFSVAHDSVDVVSDDEYAVKWVSPTLQFAVVNKTTGERIKDGFYPRAQAEQFQVQLKART